MATVPKKLQMISWFYDLSTDFENISWRHNIIVFQVLFPASKWLAGFSDIDDISGPGNQNCYAN